MPLPDRDGAQNYAGMGRFRITPSTISWAIAGLAVRLQRYRGHQGAVLFESSQGPSTRSRPPKPHRHSPFATSTNKDSHTLQTRSYWRAAKCGPPLNGSACGGRHHPGKHALN